MCKKNKLTSNKFKDIISIKSQPHHPFQPNSCSAHQDPKKIENINIIELIKKYFFFTKNIL